MRLKSGTHHLNKGGEGDEGAANSGSGPGS